MNVGLYQGAASMQALEQWQAAVSQNLAAASVPGYKKVEVDFDSVLGAKNAAAAAMPQARLRRDFSQGDLRSTGIPENVAIQGEGYFQVQAPDGQPAFTRDGEFHRSATNTLVTKTGAAVLGDGGAPLRFNPTGGAISINAQGRITQGANEVGKIAVSTLDESAAQALGGGLFRPGDGKVASTVEKPEIQSGFVEGSNVSPLRSMVELITVQRAYDANQKAIGAQDQRLSQAIQILGNPQS